VKKIAYVLHVAVAEAVVADIHNEKRKGENIMNEIENNEPCFEKINAETSCSCSTDGCDCCKPIGRKTLKVVICLVVLLAVVSILAYKAISANNSIIPNSTVVFALERPVSKITSPDDNTTQAEQNLGIYLKSLDELNTVAVSNDAVFVLISDSSNIMVDGSTKSAIIEAQKVLESNNVSVGLYTLSHDSTDYNGIAERIKLPAILVARKGASALWLSSNNANVNMLLQAYLACCDTSTNCCK
jgi:hypothetical protein